MDSLAANSQQEARAWEAVPATRADHKALLILAGLFLLILGLWLTISPIFHPVPHRDPGIYLYMAQEINRGATLYTDTWDHKPPLIFYLNALGLRLAGGSEWGVWLLQLVFLAGALVLGFQALRRAFGLLPAAFGSLSWIVMLSLLVITGNQREEWTLLFQFAALYFFLKSEHRHIHRNSLVVGVLVGLTFFVGQTLIGIGLAIGLYLAACILLRDHSRKPDLRLLGIITGGLLVVFGVSLAFAAQGTLDDMWEAGFLYNFLYARNTLQNRVDAFVYGMNRISSSGLPVIVFAAWAAGLASAASALRTRRRLEPLLAIGLIALPIELGLASLSGRNYPHYFIACIPAFAILAAYGARVVMGAMQAVDRRSPVRAAPWLPVAGLALGVALLPTIRSVERLGNFPPFQTGYLHQRVANFLRENTRPEETVLVWGAEPSINFLADRAAPTRFNFQYPLYMAGYQSPALFAQFLDELKANPPKYIIDTSGTHLMAAPLEAEKRAAWARRSQEDPNWDIYAPNIHYTPDMEIIFDYFAQHYRHIGTFGERWAVYERGR